MLRQSNTMSCESEIRGGAPEASESSRKSENLETSCNLSKEDEFLVQLAAFDFRNRSRELMEKVSLHIVRIVLKS